jgi:hypothetical protein
LKNYQQQFIFSQLSKASSAIAFKEELPDLEMDDLKA